MIKMRIQTKSIILFFAVMLVLSACNGYNPRLNCNVGTDGISASFSRDTYRQAYDEGILYPLVIDINNRGAYPSEVLLQVSHNIDIINISPVKINTSIIEGKAAWNECKGQVRKEIFNMTPRNLLAAVQEFKTDITLNVCYQYKTELNTTLCVHPNLANINMITANCRYGDKNFGGGQGSPVSFVKAEAPIYLTDGTVRIRFYLRNYRRGNIVASIEDTLESACTPSTGNYSDYVRITGHLDQYSMICNVLTHSSGPPGYVQLRADPKTTIQNNQEVVLKDYYIECQTENPVDMQSEREMSINMQLEYYYRELGVETRTINIRKV